MVSISRNTLTRLGGQVLYGLYDTDGILRFIGGDREACVAYAELFDLPSIHCCLVALPEPTETTINSDQQVRRRAKNNN